MTRKVLLIGGSGQLGTALRRQGSQLWEIHAPSRQELDVCDTASVSAAIQNLSPAVVLNCSAFHAVDRCELEFKRALDVNAIALSSMARASKSVNARFVTISTDYVFDGTGTTPYLEMDTPTPIQCYGISKLAGEQAALALHPEGAYVIRTCGLYGDSTSGQKLNFVLSRLQDAQRMKSIEVGCDLECTPTSAMDLASAIMSLLGSAAPVGIYHITNGGSCDWAAFTSEIYSISQSETEVIPVDRRGKYGEARRPKYSVLNCTKALPYVSELRSWQDALAGYLKEHGRRDTRGK